MPLQIAVGMPAGMLGHTYSFSVTRQHASFFVQVLMMVFDILASHHRMTTWHDASLDQQLAALAKLRDAKRACHARIRTRHSLKKRLSFDAATALADPESPPLAQDLISSAVSADSPISSAPSP